MKSQGPTAALRFALAGAATLTVIRYTTCEVGATIRSTRGRHHHGLRLGFAVAPCHSIAVPRQRVQQGDRWVSTGSRLWLTPPPPQSEVESSSIRDAHRGRRRKTPDRSTNTPERFRYSALQSVESGDADATGGTFHGASAETDGSASDAYRDSKVAVPGPAEQERWIRRMDMAVRRVWHQYYTTPTGDLGEARESLEAFLGEANAALAAGMAAEDIAARLERSLLGNAERLDYHFDNDEPITVYRFWLRGREVNVYERDLLHSPRWVGLVAETRRQMESRTRFGDDRMGTICYPSGEMAEGKVSSLIEQARQSARDLQSPRASAATTTSPIVAVDAEVVPEDFIPAVGEADAIDDSLEPVDVTSIPGLVSLTLKSLEDGLSDEEAILRRHLRSPDFGNPMLVLATPSTKDSDGPMVADEGWLDPAKARAAKQLTEEQWESGERPTKEMIHDRRRSHLDIFLICAAHRANMEAIRQASPGLDLCEEDVKILDDLLREAAAGARPL